MEPLLSAINLYPVKGIRAVAVDRALVTPAGLEHDRRWMVVDDRGQFLSQRTHPRLALVTGSTADGRLDLAAPGLPPLHLQVPDGIRRLQVTVWDDQVDAAAADPRADRWLSRFLGRACRLAYLDDPSGRPLSSSHGKAREVVSFADGYPCLLASTASLADLNGRLSDPLPMDRFRPNLVVEGCGAFAEDGWRRLAIGEAVFRFAGLCARCTVTTVDQQTGLSGCDEPLRTLAGYRRQEKGVMFGVNLVPERTGQVALGDRVTVLE